MSDSSIKQNKSGIGNNPFWGTFDSEQSHDPMRVDPFEGFGQVSKQRAGGSTTIKKILNASHRPLRFFEHGQSVTGA